MPEEINYRIRTIADAIPPEADVLDIGAAKLQDDRADFTHHHIANQAGKCVGIDVDTESIAKLPEYDIREAGAETFDLGETFDVVVAGEVIEHLGCPGCMLDRVREHLRPGGRVVISTPYAWMALRVRQAVFDYPFAAADHVSWFCPRTLATLLRRHGFEPVDTQLTKPKHLGISWACYRAGLQRLGAPGFIMVAVRSGCAHCGWDGEWSEAHEYDGRSWCPECSETMLDARRTNAPRRSAVDSEGGVRA